MSEPWQHPRLVTSLTEDFLRARPKRRKPVKKAAAPSRKAPVAPKQRAKSARKIKTALQMEPLEGRVVLNAAPTLESLPNVTLNAGAPLMIPLNGFDNDGDGLTFTVQSSNSAVTGSMMNGRGLRMSVAGYGDMVFQLFEELAPRTTGRIIELAQSGFYNGIIFHRVIDGFVLQAGDPTGTGSGGSQLGDFDDEFHPDLQHTVRGILSMAKSQDDTNDSQFFITEVATRHLDFNHSIFGLLTEGEAVREAISGVDTNSQDKPLTPVTITSATVFNDGQNRALMLKAPIGTTGTSTITVTASDGKGGTVERSFQVTVQADATNNNPFLLPIAAPVSVEGDQPTVIPLKAQDVEGNQVFFTVPANSNLDVTLGATQVNPVNQIAETTLTIKRKAGFLGNTTLTVIAHPTANSANTQSTSDRQALEINVTPATPSLALSAGSDTGPSVNDGVTQKNNTTTGPLTFSVTGLEAGAVVKLFSGSTLIGQGTSNGTSISVTTDGTTPLPDGPYSITATQTVGTTASKPSNAVAIVIDSKQPQFTTSPTTSVFALAPYDYNVNNDEEGTNGFAYGLVTGPAGMTINAQTGIISWTPTVAQVGVHQVVVRGRDLAGNYVDQVYDVTVNASAPTLNPIGAKSVDEEAPLNFDVTSSDPNGASETLTYSFVSGAPAGATLDPATGAFSFTPSELDGGANFSVTIRVTDSTGQFDEETIQLTVNEVNQAPVLAAIPDKAVVRDQLLTFTASATDGDRPAQTLTYSLLPGAPAGASINATTGVFTWTPTAAQSQATYTITVRVADGFTEVTDEFSVFVQDVAAAPEFPAVTNQVVDEGTTFTLNLAATDANLPNDRLTYSIQNGPAGATINAQGLLTWATTEADGPGTQSFTVLVTDALGLADTVTFSVTVNEVNQPPALAPIGDQTVDEGALLTFTATGVDADLPANTLTYSLAAGAPAGATINPSTGLFQWQTTEADGGQSYTITVQVSDGTATTSETITVTVAEVNQNPVLEAIEDRTVDEGGVVEFTLTASDADLPANTLTYSVASNVTDIVCVGMNCGSSSGSKQALDFTFDPQSGLFRWVTTEAHGPGKYVFQATVSDGQGGSDTKTFYITVNEVNNAPVITEIDDVSVAEKTLLSFTPTVADVDLPAQTLTYSLGAGAPAGATINAATGLFQWTPTEAQGPGTYSIAITVTDSGGLSDTETFSVTVTEVNDAPVIEEIADKTVNLNTTLTINVVASDPDVPAGGPLEYSLGTGAPAGMAIDAATGKLTWTPTAAQTGQSFDVRVIVKDSTGLTDEETFRATVNAAPVLDEILDQSIFEETLLAITAKANDADAITYSLAAGAPAGMTIDPTTGAIRWTPTEAEGPGEFEITVVATDTGGLSTSVSFNVIVGEANTAPVLLPVEDQSGNAGEELTFTVSAQDKDLPGNTLRFSLEPGAPEGATIDPVTGVFRWTVPTDFSESSVEIVIRVTDDGPGALSTTITVQIALTDTALVLFTNNGSNVLGTASSNSLLRSRNVSAVVVQQSVARSAAATAIENFDLPMSEADLAYMAGRIFRFGPEDGGVGPVARVDAAEAERRRREQEGETPTEQRSLKPPVDGENSTPTSGRANPSNSRPVTRTKLESRQQASLQPPAAQPVMDELFQEWETPAVDERAVECDEAAMIDFEAAWIDDATAEAFAEEQTQREDAKPQEASLGMLAIPLVVGELLARERRKKDEQQASRKPR